MVCSPDNGNEQPAGSKKLNEESSEMGSSSKTLNAQEAVVKSSSNHPSPKKNKNGKILPQTGESQKIMNVLTVVGIVIIIGVAGIKIIKHN